MTADSTIGEADIAAVFYKFRNVLNGFCSQGYIVNAGPLGKFRPTFLSKVVEKEEGFGKYRYSCYVTNLTLPAKVVYDTYRGKADSENRIKELKYDFSPDDFVSHNFWATEACGSFIIMAYNFMSLFRHALINSDNRKFLKTIRYELLDTPAYLGKVKDKHIL